MNTHSLPDGTGTPSEEAEPDARSQMAERGTRDHATFETNSTPRKQVSAKHIVLPFPPGSARAVRDAPTALPDERGERGKEVSSATPVPASLPLSPLLSSLSAYADPAPAVSLPEDDDVFTAAPRRNPVLDAMKGAGLYRRRGEGRQHVVTCPWANEHGQDERGEAIYVEPTPQRPLGGYVCPNTHAEQPRLDRLFDRFGIEVSAARCKPRIRIVQGEMIRIEHHRACAELIRRGRSFIRARQTFVGDPDCLPSIIMACIAEGAQTRDDIVRNVPRFVGHSYAEVASMLDRLCGLNPAEHYWYRDENKAYHLHIETKRRDPPVVLKLGRSRRVEERRIRKIALDEEVY